MQTVIVPRTMTYEFFGTTLAEVEQAKYLGITLSDKLDWEGQVDNITEKASNTLNFLKRNLNARNSAKRSHTLLW